MSRFRLRYRSTDLDLSLGDFVIGRSSRCNLAVVDALASRRHVVFHVGPDAVTLEDLGSLNGVMVNGFRVEGSRKLAHMDRVFVGAQELVLIDAEQITDRVGGERYVVCNNCGAISGASKRHCADCGVRLDSATGTTEQDRSGGGSLVREWGEDTRPVQTLEVIGGIAAKAIRIGRVDEAERVLIPHLDRLLERATRKLPLTDADTEDPAPLFDTATTYALKLAEAPRGVRWIDWVFRMHTATERLMSEETIDALHGLVRRHDYQRRRYVRAYLQVVREAKGDLDEPGQIAVEDVEGLAEVMLGRSAALETQSP